MAIVSDGWLVARGDPAAAGYYYIYIFIIFKQLIFVMPGRWRPGTSPWKRRTGGDALHGGNTSMKSISRQNGFANVPVSVYR
jgi:hypothetical protein